MKRSRKHNGERRHGGGAEEAYRSAEIRAQSRFLSPLFGKVAESFSSANIKGAETAFIRVDGKVRPFKAQ